MSLNFLKGPGNHHLELNRMLGGLSVLAGIGFSGAHLVINHAFSIIEFGTGMGLLLAGVGGSIAVKDAAVAKAAQTDAATQQAQL